MCCNNYKLEYSPYKNRHCQPVLSALIQGLDDHDSNNNIALEAMRGFSQMLQVVDVELVQGVQVSVALRIKPFFENGSPNVREAAFRVFGDLAKYGGTNSKAAFQEQVAGNFVCLLLHLDDCSKSVVKVLCVFLFLLVFLCSSSTCFLILYILS
jgi:hypothetical protein